MNGPLIGWKHRDRITDEAILVYLTLKTLGFESSEERTSHLIFNNDIEEGATFDCKSYDKNVEFHMLLIDENAWAEKDEDGYIPGELCKYVLTHKHLQWEPAWKETTITEDCRSFDDFLDACTKAIDPNFKTMFNEIKSFFED